MWQRLLDLAQQHGISLGMVFLDGTSIRAHSKAAGAVKKGPHHASETAVRRLAALVVDTAAKPA